MESFEGRMEARLGAATVNFYCGDANTITKEGMRGDLNSFTFPQFTGAKTIIGQVHNLSL